MARRVVVVLLVITMLGDYAITYYGLKYYGTFEANPIIAFLIDKIGLGASMLALSAFSAFTISLIYYLWQFRVIRWAGCLLLADRVVFLSIELFMVAIPATICLCTKFG